MSRPDDMNHENPEIDPKDFRRALGTFVTGVTIITTRRPNGDFAGLTANSFSSVSLSPPLVLWSLSLFAPSLRAFQESPHFSINVLAADQLHLSQKFSRSAPNKFEDVAVREGIGGVPLIEGAAASFTCRNEFRYYGGDHVIFLGAVLAYEYSDRAPLVFAQGRYVDIRERAVSCEMAVQLDRAG
jgi:3-hydroxy-9,10-secoandrosta-1,3,5(10)-triene-9,17-dione monooxygenase reductase component